MKYQKTFFFIVLFILSSTLLFSQKRSNLSLDPQKAEWFKEAKFGMFIHWGLYSLLEGSYKGHTLPDTTFANGRSWYAEWIQARLEVPSKEYKALAGQFNPVHFDADQWIREAKNAGMKYFVITSKHHDGFALWDSKVSDFNIMHTPFKRDILAELVSACKKYGLKYGFYYSHWQDWEYPGGAMPHWMDRVPDDEFEKYWREKSLPQVKELITLFDPDLLWFDTWDEETHITEERRDELISLVRELSPKCLINGRISYLNPGENIDFLEMHDNRYPDKIMDKPWQTPATMMHSWGWHANDFNWKSADRMIEYLVNNTSKGGNYLLNVGPKPDGSFPIPATRRLREMGAWLYANGDAVYGASPVRMEVPEKIYLSQKTEAGKSYLYISLAANFESVVLPIPLTNDIQECKVLESDRPIPFVRNSENITIHIPENLYKDNSVQVVRLTLKTPLID
ncbi:MAG: alpha-L-fucosidase [Bacteroidales bacterium]|nr:alpha-L-fucosidase [Bacteroidales bacterium]